MKRIITMLVLLCVTVSAFAQDSSLLRQRMEIAQTSAEVDDIIETKLEVFYMDDESPRMYYLSLGNLGVGFDILQINFDPLFELFIPLGGTLDEAIAKMEEIKDFYNEQRLATTELTGCFALGYPNDERVSVTVTKRQFLFSRILEFSLPTGSEGIVRATHISRSDFNSLLSGVKFYRKLHPDEP
jgi:hypothetical protein